MHIFKKLRGVVYTEMQLKQFLFLLYRKAFKFHTVKDTISINRMK